MKANELMIGDWVKHSITGQIGKVYRICGNEYIAFIDGDTQSELVEPIPLTPEILEKNGLANDPYGCHFKEDGDMALEISVEEEGIYWTINYNEYSILKLKYVHQLQHALKLCGIDKEIVV